jgi:hypothetical protein
MAASSSVAVDCPVSRCVSSSVVAGQVAPSPREAEPVRRAPRAPSDPDPMTPDSLENVATVSGVIVACVCGAPLPPKRGRGGKPRRFCSDRCRVRAWDAKHPRLVGGRKRPRRLWRVVDREALPASYLKAVPDTLAIGKALARGEKVPGVERVR